MGYQVVRQPLWIEGKQLHPGVKVLSGPFDLSQISSHVTPEATRPNSDPCYTARLVDLPETPDSVIEEVPDTCVTYSTTLAVESKLKKTSIPGNVILGDAVFQALDLDGPEYSTVDPDIMKRFKDLSVSYCISPSWEPTQSCSRIQAQN